MKSIIEATVYFDEKGNLNSNIAYSKNAFTKAEIQKLEKFLSILGKRFLERSVASVKSDTHND